MNKLTSHSSSQYKQQINKGLIMNNAINEFNIGCIIASIDQQLYNYKGEGKHYLFLDYDLKDVDKDMQDQKIKFKLIPTFEENIVSLYFHTSGDNIFIGDYYMSNITYIISNLLLEYFINPDVNLEDTIDLIQLKNHELF